MAPLDQLQLSPSSSSSSSYSDSPTRPSPLICESELALAFPPSPLLKAGRKSNPPVGSAAPIRILGSLVGLLGIPFLFVRSPVNTVSGAFWFIRSFWEGFLHFSAPYIAALCLVIAVYLGPHLADRTCEDGCGDARGPDQLCRATDMKRSIYHTLVRRFKAFALSVDGLAFVIGVTFFFPLNVMGSAPMLYPSWIWYPMAWSGYHIYRPAHLAPALEGFCLDQPIQDIRLPRSSWSPTLFKKDLTEEQRAHLPLCLPEQSWDTLSAGVLSSKNPQDVKAVLKGIDYARTTSGGIAIAVLGRDVKGSIEPFRQNVEALKHFVSNLSVVFFENDSTDGSRDAIKQWAQDAHGYDVDLMECAEAVDCKMGKKHRDNGGKNFATSKAVGDMDVYRQRVTDYIMESPAYSRYTHMLVVDIDIAVSLSPLGLLHTLGERPNNAVASSGRQLFPFSLGTMAPPYDMSAFRPWATEDNHIALSLHESFCAIMPPGDRWRNSCDAASPLLLMELIRGDVGQLAEGNFYRVESAFNGAVLYPLDDIRESQATYDAGEDGQRCEHVGFNMALKRPMYVNRKWDFHVDPTNMGGPSGWRAQNVVKHVTTTPRLLFTMIWTQLVSVYIFCHCFVTIGVFLLYPFLNPLMCKSKSLLIPGNNFRRLITWHQKRSKVQDEANVLHLV